MPEPQTSARVAPSGWGRCLLIATGDELALRPAVIRLSPRPHCSATVGRLRQEVVEQQPNPADVDDHDRQAVLRVSLDLLPEAVLSPLDAARLRVGPVVVGVARLPALAPRPPVPRAARLARLFARRCIGEGRLSGRSRPPERAEGAAEPAARARAGPRLSRRVWLSLAVLARRRAWQPLRRCRGRAGLRRRCRREKRRFDGASAVACRAFGAHRRRRSPPPSAARGISVTASFGRNAQPRQLFVCSGESCQRSSSSVESCRRSSEVLRGLPAPWFLQT